MSDTTKPSNPKDAIGSKKPSLSVVPMPPLYEVGNALLEGALKYGRHNYRAIGVRGSVYFDAAMRHLTAWWEGENYDPDSSIHHLSKAIAGLMVLRDAQINDNWTDDRPPVVHPDWKGATQRATTEVLARYPEPLQPYTQKRKLQNEKLATEERMADRREREIREQFEGGPVRVDLSAAERVVDRRYQERADDALIDAIHRKREFLADKMFPSEEFTVRTPIYSKPTKVRPKQPDCPQDVPGDAEELDQ